MTKREEKIGELLRKNNLLCATIEKIKSDKPELIDKIQSTGKLEEDTEKTLMQTIEEYKKSL